MNDSRGVPPDLAAALDRDGYYLRSDAFSPDDCDRILRGWEAACAGHGIGVMRNAACAVYGARNVIVYLP
jgi:hypothetical protein